MEFLHIKIFNYFVLLCLKKGNANCLKFTMNKNPFVDLSEVAENRLIPCFWKVTI